MSTAETEVHDIATDEDLRAMVENLLRDADTDLAALRRQAERGRFDSDRARRAWFVIDGLGMGNL